jgi:acyl-CoA synthetase (NDP forming)
VRQPRNPSISPDPAGADRRARRANLRRLLKPRSIAFVGGSALARGVEYTRDMGFSGKVWTVNPKRAEIGGVACLPSLADLPEIPDTVFIGTSPERAVEVVREIAAMGVPSAVCYAAGFSEVGDGSLERQLVEAAGLRLALGGPNCIGDINYFDGAPVAVSNHGLARPESGVAIIAQSGTITINLVGSDRSLPIGYLLSIGNQAVLDMADYMDVVLDDERVTALVLYVEGLKDAEAFAAAAAKAHARDVPIVVLKAGVSDMGKQIALSHTGSLAGAAELYQALFDRSGVISVATFAELLEMAKLLAARRLPKGNRIVIETCSGTDSGYCADLAERHGVALPQPSTELKEELRKVIPPIATPMNPIDVTMAQWGDREAQATSLLTLMKQPADAAGLVINYPHGAHTASYDPAIDAMIDVARQTDLPCYVITNLPEGAPAEVRSKLSRHGIVTLQGIEDAFACLGRAARYVARRDRLTSQGGPSPRLLRRPLAGAAVAHDEWQGKAWLRTAGVPVPEARFVRLPEEAAAVAPEVGFPVVVKAAGAVLLHKSELGAVALNLVDAASVQRAAAAMSAALPQAEGFIVEAMVSDGVAEVIVGARRDELFGMTLLIGAGGILAELLKDSASLLLPVREDEVREAIAALRMRPLLDGFRGRPPGDTEALVGAVLAIAERAGAEADRLVELDVNPLIVRPAGRGVVAVDALLNAVPAA